MYKNKIHYITRVGAFAAIAFVLQVIGSMTQIKVAGFLEVEFSDLPAMIIAFALGPWAGVLVELIKNVLHSAMTSTGFVGEFANFAVNGIFVFVCGSVYRRKKTKKNAAFSLVCATVALAAAGVAVNTYVMLPLYMPSADFSERLRLALLTIAPFNLCRGAVLSAIVMPVYKRISELIK